MAKSKDKIQVPLNSLLKIGIPASIVIIIAIVGGIYKLATYISQQNIDTLKTSLDQRTQEVKNLEKKVKEIGANKSSQKVQKLPQVTLDAAQNAETAKQLAEKLSHVENERDQLRQQLLQNTVSSLDPKSELHILLEQLSSDDLEAQNNAIKGLFALKEPASFAPLADFLKTHIKGIRYGGKDMYDWYDLFLEIDPNAGIELLVKDLGSQYSSRADIANHKLNLLHRHIGSVELIDAFKPYLESLALRSPNSTARARAKVMLVELSKRRAVLIEDEKEAADKEAAYKKAGKGSRTQTEILLNIEKLVKELVSRELGKPEQSAPADATPSAK